MRIYIIAHTIRGGGAETYLRSLLPPLITKMKDTEFRMTIASSKAELYQGISNAISLEEIPDSSLDNTKSRLILDNYRLFNMVSNFNPDLIFSASEVVTTKLKKLKKPIVLVYHSTLQFYMKPDFANSRLKLWYTRLMRDRAARIADLIICVSHLERAEVGMRFHDKRYEKSAVIYHGVNHDVFYPKKESEKINSLFNYPYIICVSDYHEHKKMNDMIEIFSYMVKKGVKEHLVIIGRMKNKRIEEFEEHITSLGLRNKVHMLDYIDNNKLRDVYICSKLYWTNSNAESFGMTPLEAMACGIPVFAPWRESLPEVYGDSACFYNPFLDSNKEIAEKCLKLLKDTTKLEHYAKCGYMHSLKFLWENAATEYSKIFDGIILNTSNKEYR